MTPISTPPGECGVSQNSVDSTTGDAADREYSALLYHLLSAHLLHTGLTEVRVRMTGRLLREAAAGRAPAAAAAARVSPEDLVTYRRELEWVQDQLWRRDGAANLDSQYELYMRTITKI